MARSFRDTIEKYANILEVCDSPKIISTISREANVGAKPLADDIVFLGSCGLLAKNTVYAENYRGRARMGYKITDYGRNFLKSYNELKDYLKPRQEFKSEVVPRKK